MSSKHFKAHQEGHGQADAPASPENRADLHRWIHTRVSLPEPIERELLDAVDRVLLHQGRLWRESKEQALHAVAEGFSRQLVRMRDELQVRDRRTNHVAEYYEQLVHELTDQVQRDAKTGLLTHRRFMERVETSLGLDQRGRWCAIGMIDIASFKRHNDLLGHATGDLIIERVADLLRSEVRDSDLVAYETQSEHEPSNLHARFGGDEFCFFLSSLEDWTTAFTISERFWRAVSQYDWSLEDDRLAPGAVNVDIGVVCLLRGPAAERRAIAAALAGDLLRRADMYLYQAKRTPDSHVALGRVRLEGNELMEHQD